MAPVDASAGFSLDDRVAVVTGASSGLGYRFAQVLHDAGATVVAVARRADRLEDLARDRPRIRPQVADLGDEESLDRLADAVAHEFGGADVLVNNAGSGSATLATQLSLDDLRAVMEINLIGLFRMCQLFASSMLERQRGSIVNVSSIFGIVAADGTPLSAYCASKGAVIGLTRQLASEWATSGVRVNALAPGYFRSEMTASRLDDPAGLAWVESNTPMRRPGRPEELDGALLFLASDASSYVTGHTLVVDGGWTAV